MVFTGNPGSAKTTVARLLAEIMNKEGILRTGEFIECGRADLVGEYVGQTAPKVKNHFRLATGGILFIDEAYSLVEHWEGSYGDEAISTIVQEMENRRNNVIVIFAGYPDKMKNFLSKNEGLRSRIAFHVDFPNYNADELLQILQLMAKNKGFELNTEIEDKCREIFSKVCNKEDFGNGRFVRNLFEQALMKQSQRIIIENDGKEIGREELLKLKVEDFEVNVVSQYSDNKGCIGFKNHSEGI
jgi:AAA+ superfamily predicted ATPase